MKKFNFFFLCLLATSLTFAQTVFNGNTRSGFGGPVGGGKISITDDATNINFAFTKGTSGDLNDALVIYIDSKAGGFSSTASSTDNGDGLRTATSGYSTASNKSVLTFPAGFAPDYAISFDKGFASVFSLIAGGTNSLVYVASANLTPTTGAANAPIFSFSVTRAQISIGSATSFKFLGAYISETAYRSNEFIGDAGPIANIAYTDYAATTYLTYNLTVVLPVTITSFSGTAINQTNKLTWTTEQEVNVNNYKLMHSTNGIDFAQIGSVSATGSKIYIYTDVQPSLGNNFYRLVAVDNDGKQTVSNTINVSSKNALSKIKSTVNAAANLLYIRFNAIDKGVYNIRLINNIGQIVSTNIINHTGNDATYDVSLPIALEKGIYHVAVSSASDNFSQLIIVR